MGNSKAWGTIYGMGFLGSVVYLVQHAGGFWAGVLGIIKALFWPAVLMYELLEHLKI
ncbi:MAG: hypothetical protein JW699_02460 [Chitinispirillaceae bacterium]|nr:hypothetical protein [Chitinispirillaceae bacterium]